jgi:hypothetical protein
MSFSLEESPRRNVFRLFVVACILTLTCLVNAQIKRAGKKYLFRYKFASGTTIRYSIDTEVERPDNGPTFISGAFVQSVKTTMGTSAQIAATFGPLISGKRDVMAAAHYSFNEDHLGKLDSPNAPQMFPEYPTRPLAVGESWDNTTSGLALASKSTIDVRYTFVGITRLEGHDVAKLSLKFIASGQADTTGLGTDYMLLSDGSLWRSDFRMIMTPPGGVGKLRATQTLKR